MSGHSFVSIPTIAACFVCDQPKEHADHAGHPVKDGDAIAALSAAVKRSGLTMTLHGKPVTEDELRGAALSAAEQRVAAAFEAGRGAKSRLVATHLSALAEQVKVHPAVLVQHWPHCAAVDLGTACDCAPAPRFRYLDRPILLTDGSILRWPMVGVPSGGGWTMTLRLRKRRRRCTTCGHRHGPTRNNPAVRCCAQRAGSTKGPVCGCTEMTDWPPPAELLGQPKASGSGRGKPWGARTVECAWCGHDIVHDNPATHDDDAGWSKRAAEHSPTCAWVTARGNEDRMFPLSQDDYCGPRDP